MLKLDKYLTSSYVRNFLLLSSGTFLAQLVPVIFYPIVSRLFTPADFGILAAINSIATIVATIATGKYETGILIAKSDGAASNIWGLVMSLSILLLSVQLCIFYIFVDFFARLLNNPGIVHYFYIPFISAFAIIIYQSYNEWCVRNKYFKNLSFNKIVNSSSVSAIETIMGLTKVLGGGGLIVGDLVGRLISAFSCLYHGLKKDGNLIRYVSLKRMLLYAKRYIDCPKYVMPGQLLNTLGVAMPVFVIGAFFSQQEVGFFSMANMVILLPASVISLAMRDVFRQKANDDFIKKGNCKMVYLKTLLPLSVMSCVGFLILYFMAPVSFKFVLGEPWMEAGIYARILIPVVAISFISDVLGATFIVAEKMKYVLYWQIFYFVMTLIPLFIGGYCKNIYLLLYLFMICRACAYIVNMFLSYHFAKN